MYIKNTLISAPKRCAILVSKMTFPLNCESTHKDFLKIFNDEKRQEVHENNSFF